MEIRAVGVLGEDLGVVEYIVCHTGGIGEKHIFLMNE